MTLRALVVISVLGSLAPVAAQSLPAGLESGPRAVGFRIATYHDASRPVGGRVPATERTGNRARPLRVHIWYPAAARGATTMTVGDYLDAAGPAAGAHREDVSRLSGLRPTDAEWSTYLGYQLTAARDATPARGEHPLIVGMLRPVSMAVSAEHLASHGYVVALVERQPREAVVAEGLAREALVLNEYVRDMQVIAARLREETYVDKVRLGAIGFSGDGLAQLILAMRHPDVDAVSLLETGWLSPAQINSYQESTEHDPLALRAALFYAYSENLGRNSVEHVAELTGMRYAPRSLLYIGEPKMTHLDFATEGLVLTEVLEARRQAHAQLSRAALAMHNYQLTFMEAWVKGRATAQAAIGDPPHTPPGGALIELTYEPAIEPALSRGALISLIDRDVTEALARARADLARDPLAPVFEADWLNNAGYVQLQRGQPDRAIALMTLYTDAHPRSANAFDSLSEVLEAAGRTDEARAAATRALELLPGDSTVPSSQKSALEAGLKDRLARLAGGAP